jgi:hypothetical protein
MYSVLGTEAMDVLLSLNFVTIYFLFRCAAGWRQKKEKEEKNIDHHGQRTIPNICHLPDADSPSHVYSYRACTILLAMRA